MSSRFLSRAKLTRCVNIHDLLLLYGLEGVGKTEWASKIPGVLFFPTEEGQHHVDGKALGSREIPENDDSTPQVFEDTLDDDGNILRFGFLDIMDALAELIVEDHDYLAVALDTVDGIEPLIASYVCDRDKKDSIDAYGYGKGHAAVREEIRNLLSRLKMLRRRRGLGVYLLGHSQVKTHHDPNGESFDRHILKMNDKNGALIKEAVDCVLFAAHDVHVIEDDNTPRAKGISTGKRSLYTQWSAAYDAKNRFSLPAKLPLHFADYVEAKAAGSPADASEVLKEIEALARGMDAALSTKVKGFIKDAGGDSAKLCLTLDWCRGKVAA